MSPITEAIKSIDKQMILRNKYLPNRAKVLRVHDDGSVTYQRTHKLKDKVVTVLETVHPNKKHRPHTEIIVNDRRMW